MKKNKSLLVLVVCASMFSGCVKEEAYNKKGDSTADGVVFLQQAVSFPQELTIFPFVDAARTFTFNAGFGAVGYSSKDINVKIEIDNAAFDSINRIRQTAGLPLYLKFPADAYTIDAMETTIQSGNLTSGKINVNYFSKKFNPLMNYLLPMSIKEASGYTVNPKLKTVFIVVSKLQGKLVPTSLKSTWVITADSEELVGEGSNGGASKAIDGDIATYWHTPWYLSNPPFPHWLRIDMKQPNFIDRISMAPRQNNSNGFVLFKLEGSLDGTTWTMLGNNLVFDPTKRDGTFQEFAITPTSVQFIKITMLQSRVSTEKSTHLGEINVYKY
jgi:hypothetical protein